MHTNKPLRALSLILLLMASTVVVLGAYTRLADAGLGCPDWPTCYGHLWVPNSDHEIAAANERFTDTPVETHKTWPEQIHRIFASSLGVFILITFTLVNARRAKNESSGQINSVSILLILLVVGTVLRIALGPVIEAPLSLIIFCYFANIIRVARKNRHQVRHRDSYILASTLAGLVVLQGLFGMWTVTLKLWPQVVTAHLLGGFATLSLIALLLKQCWIGSQHHFSASKNTIFLGYVTLAFVILQIALGGWMSSNYAALACPDLPLCQNSLLPPMDFASGFNFLQHVGPNYLYGKLDSEARTAIHYSHRMGALVVTCLVICFITCLIKLKKTSAKVYAFVLSLVLCIQVGLGLSNIYFALPIEVAVLHNAGGAALLICVLYTLNSMKLAEENQSAKKTT